MKKDWIEKFSVQLIFNWKELLLLGGGGWFSVAVSHICFMYILSLRLCLIHSMVYFPLDFCFLAFIRQFQYTRIYTYVLHSMWIFKIKAKLLWVSWINRATPRWIYGIRVGCWVAFQEFTNTNACAYICVCMYIVYTCVKFYVRHTSILYNIASVYFHRCLVERVRGKWETENEI